MSFQNAMDRRNFLSTVAAAVGGGSILSAVSVSPDGKEPLPEGILPGDPLAHYWQKNVSNLIDVKLPQELSLEAIQERHRIYALLLMALVARFWNGNNSGPLGIYPFRKAQKAADQGNNPNCLRYKGDMNATDDPQRISWDRYLGHNIACIAVDAKGEILDFDFNHNAIFRSSAEHAESRMVRRLFSLTDLIDDWKIDHTIPRRAHLVDLKGVTIYTSLESCAQCSGVMSLARIKQVVYLQNDPGAYRIGNIMYNLAGRDKDGSLAAQPIPASEIGLPYLDDLNHKYEKFRSDQTDAQVKNNVGGAYFVPCSGSPVTYTSSITSFLCTDTALETFQKGAKGFHAMVVKQEGEQNSSKIWSNAECLAEAHRFFEYADVEGFRGSPHKL
jgi:tRNA(Arg) A34 adenosine deaminase TadA